MSLEARIVALAQAIGADIKVLWLALGGKAPATTGAAVLKGNGEGGFAAAEAGTDFARPDTATAWTGEQAFKELKETVYAIADAAGFEIDPANGSVQTVTLGANRTPTATAFESGQYVLLGIDDGSGYTVTWTTVAVTWTKVGGSGTAPSLIATGKTWVLLWKVGATLFGSHIGDA